MYQEDTRKVWVFVTCYVAVGFVEIPENTSPDSANGRASASGAGGCGFDPGPRHTKGVKNGTSGYIAWRSAL